MYHDQIERAVIAEIRKMVGGSTRPPNGCRVTRAKLAKRNRLLKYWDRSRKGS